VAGSNYFILWENQCSVRISVLLSGLDELRFASLTLASNHPDKRQPYGLRQRDQPGPGRRVITNKYRFTRLVFSFNANRTARQIMWPYCTEQGTGASLSIEMSCRCGLQRRHCRVSCQERSTARGDRSWTSWAESDGNFQRHLIQQYAHRRAHLRLSTQY
jgi:hypothetical protein